MILSISMYQEIDSWLLNITNFFEETLLLLNENKNLTQPDLEAFYIFLLDENNMEYLKYNISEELLPLLSLYKTTYPIFTYVKYLKVVNDCHSIQKFIKNRASEKQIYDINQNLLIVSTVLSKQLFILDIYKELEYIPDVFINTWQDLNCQILNLSTNVFQIISELYMKKHLPNIKGLLMNYRTAFKWFNIIFAPESEIMKDTEASKQKILFFQRVYKIVSFISLFVGCTCTILMFFGSKENRDIYILLLVLSVLAVIGVIYHRNSVKNSSHICNKQAFDFLDYHPGYGLEEMESSTKIRHYLFYTK